MVYVIFMVCTNPTPGNSMYRLLNCFHLYWGVTAFIMFRGQLHLCCIYSAVGWLLLDIQTQTLWLALENRGSLGKVWGKLRFL